MATSGIHSPFPLPEPGPASDDMFGTEQLSSHTHEALGSALSQHPRAKLGCSLRFFLYLNASGVYIYFDQCRIAFLLRDSLRVRDSYSIKDSIAN